MVLCCVFLMSVVATGEFFSITIPTVAPSSVPQHFWRSLWRSPDSAWASPEKLSHPHHNINDRPRRIANEEQCLTSCPTISEPPQAFGTSPRIGQCPFFGWGLIDFQFLNNSLLYWTIIFVGGRVNQSWNGPDSPKDYFIKSPKQSQNYISNPINCLDRWTWAAPSPPIHDGTRNGAVACRAFLCSRLALQLFVVNGSEYFCLLLLLLILL